MLRLLVNFSVLCVFYSLFLYVKTRFRIAMTCERNLVNSLTCSVQRRVEFKVACLVHQSLASLAPTYLTTDIHLVSEYGRRPLRSSTDRTLTVLRTHNRFGDRSFAVAGPRLWNSLPISLRQICSYGQFRR